MLQKQEYHPMCSNNVKSWFILWLYRLDLIGNNCLFSLPARDHPVALSAAAMEGIYTQSSAGFVGMMNILINHRSIPPQVKGPQHHEWWRQTQTIVSWLKRFLHQCYSIKYLVVGRVPTESRPLWSGGFNAALPCLCLPDNFLVQASPMEDKTRLGETR